MQDARAATERRADAAIAQARDDAQRRVADAEARLAGERGAREAAEARVAAIDRQLEPSTSPRWTPGPPPWRASVTAW
jgi:vacuolar-type H+-ATPase subunit H